MEVYDPLTNKWTAGPSMSTARSGLGVGVVHDKLYAVGGSSSVGTSSVLASMEVFWNASAHAV